MKTFEKVASLFALIGTTLMLMSVHAGTTIFAYSILALSLMYFFWGFAFFNSIPLRNIFKRSAYASLPRYHVAGGIFTGIALFFACMGILFKLLWWPGALIELAGGIAFCFIILFISFIKKTAKYPNIINGS